MRQIIKYLSVLAVMLSTLTINVSAQQPTKQEIRDARKSKEALPSSVTTITTSVEGQYNLLLQEKARLSGEVEQLEDMSLVAKKSKQKKMQKEIADKNAQMEILDRRIQSFPESVRNPESVQKGSDEEFLRQLDSKAQAMIQSRDPFYGTISNDPALEKNYRDFINKNGYIPLYDNISGEIVTDPDEVELTYRIMLAIERSALPTSTFKSMEMIFEQRMADGSIIYYQGNYATKGEAEAACANIVKQNVFRDAFVVAMRGAMRVDM